MRWITLTTAAAATAMLASAGVAREDSGKRFTITLSGEEEVTPGDPDGSGSAVIRINPGSGQLCYTLRVRGIDPATAAHIHRGPAGTAGPPVVPLATPDGAGRSEGCASVEQDVAFDIANRPFDYYVNVHTAAFPAGAVRGQLRGEVGRLRR